jgi:hypothetical protein
MLIAELLSLVASLCTFAAGFLIGAWWGRRRTERIVVVPASPPMRPRPPQVITGVRSRFAPPVKPAAKPVPRPTDRILRWRPDAPEATTCADSPPKPATKPSAVVPPKPPMMATAIPVPADLLPSVAWGRSCRND